MKKLIVFLGLLGVCSEASAASVCIVWARKGVSAYYSMECDGMEVVQWKQYPSEALKDLLSKGYEFENTSALAGEYSEIVYTLSKK